MSRAGPEVSPPPAATPPGANWAQQWSELVSAAVLGTDRRPLGPTPAGPLAELFDPHQGDDASRLLDRAAALAAVRRAGLRPDAPPPPLPPCPPDARPPCPARAARRLGELLEAWPILVEEWLTVLVERGYRLPPEHAVALLERHRADARRRALVEAAAGPLAAWLTQRFPDRLSPRRPTPGGPPSGATALEPPAVELPADVLAVLALPPGQLAASLVDGLLSGRFVARHRPLLLQVVCRLDREALLAVAAALAEVATPGPALLAGDLAALARTRLDLRVELEPPEADTCELSGVEASRVEAGR